MGKLREINGGVFREVDGSPEVGDFIVYDEVPDSYCLTAGKPYEVIETDYHGEDYVLIEDDDNEEYNAINDNFTVLKRASQAEALRYLLDKRRAEVAELEEKLEEASRLKVGDYAKVIEVDPCDSSYGAAVGDIVQVIRVDYDHLPHKCIKCGGPDKYEYWFYLEHLERATDEEVAAAKQEEKWAKIGRKVNEFKVGDIVRYAYKSENSNAIGESGFSGILAEIDKVNPVADSVRLIKPSFVDDSRGTWAKLGELTLIALAENRTDL
ncbi:hypothetical protein M5W68_06835 [Paenibacillus larvae]|uniref:hypothetical protein n=1 Tax=Paenibacillus larvae TaxID=1464 RepID=UPI00227E0F47|nr:hypothetical protein [Paenibacillus larvae]MCY9512339.1 hypothetical protein [Paenibacillus larvae]MCY9524874.1 hypothetical protein [Paenibacillus larvae]